MKPRTPLLVFLLLLFTYMSIAGSDLGLATTLSTHEPIFNLYKVLIRSQIEADALSSSDCDPILKVADGYLVLATPESVLRWDDNGLEYELLETGIVRSEIAMDMRQDRENVGKYQLLFDEGGPRLFRVEADVWEIKDGKTDIAMMRDRDIPIIFRPQRPFTISPEKALVDLETLSSSILQDSLESYSYRLQAFNGRPAGSASMQSCANWLATKFREFGYDSVAIEIYWDTLYDEWAPIRNVIAYKIGDLYPDYHVVVGAHSDAEPGSPGADDNGSGTAAVLEIARVMAEMETNVTYVFALWDGEEEGLLGSWLYAGRAFNQNERIVLNVNMDMIAHYQNNTNAKVYTNNDDYLQLTMDLADSLESINLTYHYYGGGGTDYIPFEDMGYEVVALHEYIFSSVYHSYRDSTSYLNFDYMTRITRSAAVIGYVIGENYVPETELIMSSPEGLPQVLYPGSATSLRIVVNEYGDATVVPGSVLLHYSVNDAEWLSEPMVEMGGALYEGLFPAMVCGDRVQYYITAEESSLGTYYYPGFDSRIFACVSTDLETVLVDDFGTDQGWESTSDAARGDWVRGRTSSSSVGGVPSADIDGNRYCYQTDSDFGMDVDAGSVTLMSPSLDASGGPTLLHYSRWYSNHTGSSPYEDIFNIVISSNNGVSWAQLETIGPEDQSSGGWYSKTYWIDQITTPTAEVRLRFIAADNGDDSQVEAAVDAVRVEKFTFAPLIITESLPHWTVGTPYGQQLVAIGCSTEYTWSDKYGHLEGTNLTVSPTGLVSGTPLTEGLILFAAEAVDELGEGDERMYSFMINPGLMILTEELTDAVVGLAYDLQLSGDGGTGIKIWMDKNNDLEGTGLSLSADGNLSGTPLDTGTISLVIRVEDEVGAFAESSFALSIDPDYDCGDANGDRQANIADAVYIINYVFKGGPAPDPIQGGDANCDGEANVGDAVYLINYVFKGGPEPCCP